MDPNAKIKDAAYGRDRAEYVIAQIKGDISMGAVQCAIMPDALEAYMSRLIEYLEELKNVPEI